MPTILGTHEAEASEHKASVATEGEPVGFIVGIAGNGRKGHQA